MFYLARKDYPDRMMDDADLDAVADLWRTWHHARRWGAGGKGEAYQFLELRLWGFARDRSAALVSRLRKSLDSYGLPETAIELYDPDTIRVAGPPVPVGELLPRGLWLDLFRGEEFAGLPLMVRLAISEFRDQPEGHADDSTGLVLVGSLREERLQLKAIWPNSTEGDRLDDLFRMAVWPEEMEFLRALDDFHATSRAGPVKAELFVSRRQEQVAFWVIRLLFDLPGQAKLPAFLGRVGFFACLTILAALLLSQLPILGPHSVPLAMLGLIGLAGFGFNGWWKARTIYRYHSRMKAALRNLYSGSINYVPVDLVDLGVANNPAVVKYTCELEAIGARHLIDVRPDPHSSRSYIRLFQLSEDHTYVFLNIMLATQALQFYPAHPFLLVMTCFADGSRLVSVNTKASGYQKPRKANVISRRFQDAKDPGELLAAHRQVLKRLLDEGRQLAPLMTAGGLLQYQIKEHEESRVLAKKQGYYTWGAALRQSFGLVRREYLEEG